MPGHTPAGQRIEKTLDDAGVELDSVAWVLLGMSRRRCCTQLVAGERDPDVLAELDPRIATATSETGISFRPQGDDIAESRTLSGCPGPILPDRPDAGSGGTPAGAG